MRGLLLAVWVLYSLPAGAITMGPIEINGYKLSSAEYLPFVGDQTLHYPDDVLWGFYPGGATQSSIDCAQRAFDKLIGIFASNPAPLRQAVSLGATPYFTLWINDYSQSAPRLQYRPSQLWHPSGDSQDYRRGTWVWEATLSRDYSCDLPDDAEVAETLNQAAEALARP